MHDSESKIDAMLTCTGAVLDSWEFILEKRACGIEMFSLCNIVSEALTDCQHMRGRVLLGEMPRREGQHSPSHRRHQSYLLTEIEGVVGESDRAPGGTPNKELHVPPRSK